MTLQQRRAVIAFACLVITEASAAQTRTTDLERLLALAKSQTASERLDAARGLGTSSYPKAATDALLVLVTDKQWFVRVAAADSLRSRLDPATVTPLAHAAEVEADARVRDHLTAAIEAIKRSPAYGAFALDDADAEARVQAARAAAYGSDPTLGAKLRAMLSDPVAAVRYAAAESLVTRRDPAVIPFEIRTLEAETDTTARLRAAEALGELRATDAVDAMLRIVANPSDPVRTRVVAALGDIGDPRAAQPIVDAMSHLMSSSWYEWSLALSKLGDAGVSALIGALRSADEEVRIVSARGLGLLKDGRVASALVAALNDPSDAVRGHAATSLGQIGDRAAVRPLIDALRRRSARSNSAVAAALGRLGDHRAVPALVDELAKPIGLEESTFILRALGELGGAEALDTLDRVLERRFASAYAFTDLDRQYAAESIAAIGGARAETILYNALARGDLPAIQGGARYFIAIGRDGSEVALAKALDPANPWLSQLAELYLASENPTLVGAARAWAAARGATLSRAAYRPVKWKQGAMPK